MDLARVSSSYDILAFILKMLDRLLQFNNISQKILQKYKFRCVLAPTESERGHPMGWQT